MRENMTDLADVATLPAGWASDLRVNQAKHADSIDLRIYKCFGILPR